MDLPPTQLAELMDYIKADKDLSRSITKKLKLFELFIEIESRGVTDSVDDFLRDWEYFSDKYDKRFG